MYVRMKKQSNVKKSNIRINRNFFIIQGVLIGILLYLTWGKWVKFAIFVTLEIAAYTALVYYFLTKQASRKSKKRAHSGKAYSKVKSSNSKANEYSSYREIGGRSRKNYNWEITKNNSERKVASSFNNVIDNVDKSSENSIRNSQLSERDNSISKLENKKFVPYRSPFDPIKPKEEEQKTEIENLDEVIEENVSIEETVNSEEIEPQYDEEAEQQDNEEIELQEEEESNDFIMFEDIDEVFDEDLEESLEESIEEDFLNVQMDSSRRNEIFDFDFKLDNNTYEDSNSSFDENDLKIDIVKKEELDYPLNKAQALDYPLNQAQAVHQERKEVIPQKVQQEENKAIFREERAVSQVTLNRPPVKDYKTVHSDTKPLSREEYKLPVDLLNKNDQLNNEEEIDDYIEYNAYKLIDTLASFGVGAKILDVSKGPTVTRYELQPNAGIKVSKILNLADDIALNLAATGVRIEAPIPGKAAVGIEIPNEKNVPVFLRDVVSSQTFQNYPSKLAFGIGKDIAGNVVVGDIAKMPHLLIAGATGSGKSVCINTLIVSILYKASPKDVRLLMVDPKVVELGIYNGIPHLLIPVVTEPKKAAGALNWAVVEMTSRYKLFAENNVRDLNSYNELIKERGEGETLPRIVIIIDELADLMMVAPNEVEDSICRLAQMARAAGMHLVIATQRPSVNVITGVIKANIPSRISFAVSSQIDSRTILDMAGAEKLLGRGDMLFYPLAQPKPIRVQGSFISDREVDKIVTHIKSLQGADYDEEILQKIDNQNEMPKPDTGGDDELLPQAIEMVLEMGQASASLIQRKFKVGYSRAARILDQMESWGVVSASDGSKPRQILITKQEWDELNS